MSEEEKVGEENPEEQINEDNPEGEEEKKDEPLLDSDGNPINPEDLLPKEPQNPLKKEVLIKSVKNLQRTYNGVSYAYTELDLREKELDEIGEELNGFTEIRDFNVSNNKLPHINPIGNMPYLVRVDASVNEIKDVNVLNNPERFQFLQILNLKQNKIHVLPEMQAANLLTMDLSENKINDCSQFKGLPRLKKLNLNQNRLKDCMGLANCPNLEVLYVNGNRLTSIKGIENLPNLRKLRLRTNQIEKFDYVPGLPNLEKLAISENQIKDNKQLALLRFPKLKRINVESNPYFDESGVSGKIEILIQLEGFDIKFVNKEEIVPEDKEEVVRVKEERKQKEEEERIQREEEEKQRKEEEERLRKEKEEEERLKKEEEEKERKEKEEEERLKKEEEDKANEENEGREEQKEEEQNEEGGEEENNNEEES